MSPLTFFVSAPTLSHGYSSNHHAPRIPEGTGLVLARPQAAPIWQEPARQLRLRCDNCPWRKRSRPTPPASDHPRQFSPPSAECPDRARTPLSFQCRDPAWSGRANQDRRVGRGTDVIMVSEAAREREAFRYDPSLLTSQFAYTDDGNLPSPVELPPAADPVLSALAQLGTYETGAERALVSLFDSTYQYIVAEARPQKGAAHYKPSLYGLALPRVESACNHVLELLPQNGTTTSELPLSVVPDLATDSRFTSLAYCQYGKGSQFYAGVPIRTGKGINIGTFCVMNEKQPVRWDDDCLQHLKNISGAIMHHLEMRRSSTMSRRHERVNTGIGSFIEGKSALAGPDSSTALKAQDHDSSLASNDKKVQEQSSHSIKVALSDVENKAGDLPSLELADGLKDRPQPDGTPNRPTPNSNKKDQQDLQGDNLDPESIFYRAASIIQQAFEVDGCAFVRVPYGSYRDLPSLQPPQPNDVVDAAGFTSSASSGEEQQHNVTEGPHALHCETITHVVKTSFGSDGKQATDSRVDNIPKSYMAKLLRKYPRGTIFSLDAAGELQASDSSEEDGTSHYGAAPDGAGAIASGANQEDLSTPQERQASRRQKANTKEAAILRQAFPSARSIVFVPVWDYKRERWLSGGFVYTCVPNRPFSPESDLSLLDAFSRLVASEVLNAETQKEEKAKADALGSLSHELRSPLHGINLSTELLNDTDLSVFQGNALHTIEVCCRTMLDTIDHLLDFSKVNSLSSGRAKDSSAVGRYRHPNSSSLRHFVKKSLLTHVRLDGLVEEVVASVFAGFNFQHMSVRPRSTGRETATAEILITSHKALDGQFAADQLSAMFEKQGTPTVKFGNTSVHITIDPTCDWLFHTHPGAIRRIVMNLFGNALKYTPSGLIRVSLSQEPSKRSTTERLVKLTVQDTGKGIGEDYLRNGIFQPFTQEDKLSQGTGLGLSLVKRITNQLRGKIFVESQIGLGTTFTVTLPLEQPSQSPPTGEATGDAIFEKHLQELRGLRVVIQGFESEGNTAGHSAIEDICTGWLHMEVLRDTDNLKSADLVVRSEDTLSDSQELLTHFSQTPNVVVSRDAPAAWRLFTANEGVDERRVFEYMSQPIGPRTLARSIVHAYHRWADLPKPSSMTAPPALTHTPGSRKEQLPTLGTDLTQASVDQASSLSNKQDFAPEHVKSEESVSLQTATETATDKEEPQATESGGVTTRGRYLLVDDNLINLKVLSAFMAKLGQLYTLATNGKAAVETYTQNPNQFIGIMMDISMPVMDGLEATRWIRAHERENKLRAVPVLALTGLSSHETHCEALESGVDVFLTKPVGFKTLRQTLEDLDLPLSLPQLLPHRAKPS